MHGQPSTVGTTSFFFFFFTVEDARDEVGVSSCGEDKPCDIDDVDTDLHDPGSLRSTTIKITTMIQITNL